MQKISDTIADLFVLAKSSSDQNIANSIVQKARRIAKKHQFRLPAELRRQYCHHCYSFFRQGENCTTRLTNKCCVVTCKICKKMTKYGYKV